MENIFTFIGFFALKASQGFQYKLQRQSAKALLECPNVQPDPVFHAQSGQGQSSAEWSSDWAAQMPAAELWACSEWPCRMWKITDNFHYGTTYTHKLFFLLTLSASKNLHVLSTATTLQVITAVLTSWFHFLFCTQRECLPQRDISICKNSLKINEKKLSRNSHLCVHTGDPIVKQRLEAGTSPSGVCALQSPFWLNSAQGKLQLPRWLWWLAREEAAHSTSQQIYPLQNTQKDLRKSSGGTSGSLCMPSYNLWFSLLDGSPLVTFFPLLHSLSSIPHWATR